VFVVEIKIPKWILSEKDILGLYWEFKEIKQHFHLQNNSKIQSGNRRTEATIDTTNTHIYYRSLSWLDTDPSIPNVGIKLVIWVKNAVMCLPQDVVNVGNRCGIRKPLTLESDIRAITHVSGVPLVFRSQWH
jgi:hypothetical protein